MRPLRPTDPPQVGAFRLDGILGEGSQGTAYLATGPDGQLVAVKLLHAHLVGDAEAQQRFLREVQVATRVARFCTAQVLTTGTAFGRPFIVSEYVAGPTLEAAVNRSGPRSGGAIDRLAIGTATALAAIHHAGILHRDFKPANVIVSQDGPVVIDFGIARALDGGGQGLTQTGLTVGTPAYMAPEQISDAQEIGPAADVFSWACTIVFAATGQPPFPGSSVPGLFEHILHGQPDLGSMSGPIRDVAHACLAKDPAQRPTAEQLVAWLTGDAIPVHQHPAERHPDELPTVNLAPDPWRQSAAELGTYLSGAHPAEHQVPGWTAVQPAVQPAGDQPATAPPWGLRGLARKPLLVTLGIVIVLVLAAGAGYALAGHGGETPAAAGTGAASTQAAVATSPPLPSPSPTTAPPPVPVGPNLAVDGSFGSGSLGPWHGAGAVRVVRGGPRGHMVKLSSAGASVEEVIHGLRPGVAYKLSVLIASAGGQQTLIDVGLYGGPRSGMQRFTTSSHWTEETVYFTPGPGHRTARVACLHKGRGAGFCTAIVVRAMS
jgi:eukaryotic-like serine/threonine-protein kinase